MQMPCWHSLRCLLVAWYCIRLLLPMLTRKLWVWLRLWRPDWPWLQLPHVQGYGPPADVDAGRTYSGLPRWWCLLSFHKQPSVWENTRNDNRVNGKLTDTSPEVMLLHGVEWTCSQKACTPGQWHNLATLLMKTIDTIKQTNLRGCASNVMRGRTLSAIG